MRKHKSNVSEIKWVVWADRFYVTARFLYWNKFIYNSALFGAHAIELYLKAFLIFKTGEYIKGHELGTIYRECQQLDPFFKDDSLSKYFLSEKKAKVLMPEFWPNYAEYIRYPESLPTQEDKRKSFGFISGSDTAGTLKSLDRISGFIHKTIVLPQNAEGVFKDLFDGYGNHHSLGETENKDVIIQCLLKDNPYLE